MSVTIEPEAPPLRREDRGRSASANRASFWRWSPSEFQDGATPEAIVQSYPTITLADAYATIAYALRHPREIEAYLAEREQKAEEVRRKIEATQGDLGDIRRRLLARRAGMRTARWSAS